MLLCSRYLSNVVICLFSSFHPHTDQNKQWIIPAEGKEDYIEDKATGMVLGISQDYTSETSPVVLEPKKVPISNDQMWLRGTYRWFSLTNPISGRVLPASSTLKTTIEGNK